MKGKIYLICDPLSDTFKIGVTKRDVNERLKEIQTCTAGDAFVCQTFESKYPYKLEAFLHRKYFSKRLTNEWFDLDIDDIKSFIQNCMKYEKILESVEDPDWIYS